MFVVSRIGEQSGLGVCKNRSRARSSPPVRYTLLTECQNRFEAFFAADGFEGFPAAPQEGSPPSEQASCFLPSAFDDTVWKFKFQ